MLIQTEHIHLNGRMRFKPVSFLLAPGARPYSVTKDCHGLLKGGGPLIRHRRRHFGKGHGVKRIRNRFHRQRLRGFHGALGITVGHTFLNPPRVEEPVAADIRVKQFINVGAAIIFSALPFRVCSKQGLIG